MILKASAENGSSSSALRSSSSLPLRSMPVVGGRSSGRRQVVDDRVEQRLHALVLERRAAEHRARPRWRWCRARMRVAQVVGGDLLLAEVLLEDGVVVVATARRSARGGTPRPAPARSAGMSATSHLAPSSSSSQTRAFIVDQVDDALEVALGADRELDDGGGGVEAVLDACRAAVKKSAPMRSILLMKQMRGTPYLLAWRHTVSVCGSTPATPSNTATAPSSTRSERSTSTVKSTWPGVSMMLIRVVVPDAGGGGRRDGDAALLLLDHPVHRGGALVDLTDLVVLAGVVEDPLGRRGLARVDVGHDPDVAGRGPSGNSRMSGASAMVGVSRRATRAWTSGRSAQPGGGRTGWLGRGSDYQR